MYGKRRRVTRRFKRRPFKAPRRGKRYGKRSYRFAKRRRYSGKRRFLRRGGRRTFRRYGLKKFPNPVVRINDISPVQTSLSVARGSFSANAGEVGYNWFGMGQSLDLTNHIWLNTPTLATDPGSSTVDVNEVSQLTRLWNPNNFKLKISVFWVHLRRDSGAGDLGSNIFTDYTNAVAAVVPSAQAGNFNAKSFMANPYMAPDFVAKYRISKKRHFVLQPGQRRVIKSGFRGFTRLTKADSDTHNLKKFCRAMLLFWEAEFGIVLSGLGVPLGYPNTPASDIFFENWHRCKYRYRPVNNGNYYVPGGTLDVPSGLMMINRQPVYATPPVTEPATSADMPIYTHAV